MCTRSMIDDTFWLTDDLKSFGKGIFCRSQKIPQAWTTEIYTIEMCATEILNKHCRHKSMTKNDNQTVLKTLKPHKFNFKLIQNCKNALNTFGTANNLSLTCIPEYSLLLANGKQMPLQNNGLRSNFRNQNLPLAWNLQQLNSKFHLGKSEAAPILEQFSWFGGCKGMYFT